MVGKILDLANQAVQSEVRRSAADNAAEQNARQERAAVQRRLNELGYDAGEPDGAYGPRTRKAISEFQRSIGEEPTGKITEAQIDRLYGDGAGGHAAPVKAAAAPTTIDAKLSPTAERFGWLVRNENEFLVGVPGRRDQTALSQLIVLGAYPALIDTNHIGIGLLVPDILKKYLSKEGLSDFERGYLHNGSMAGRAFRGADEFEVSDTLKEFVAEARPAIEQMLVELPITVAYVRQVSFGAYSAKRGGFDLNVDRWEDGGFGAVSSQLIPNFEIAEPRDRLPGFLAMSESDGRKLRELERQQEEALPDSKYFVESDGSVTSLGSFVYITRYRLDRLTLDKYDDLEGEISLIDAGIYAASDLDTPLFTLELIPEPEPEPLPEGPKGPSAEEVAEADRLAKVLAGSLDGPASRFDILGITLGMPIDEAKGRLRAQYEKLNYNELTWERSFDWGRNCEADIGRAYSEEKSRIRSEHEANYFDAAELDRRLTELEAGLPQRFIDSGCPLPPRAVMTIGFGLTADRGQGLVENVVLYQTTTPSPVVAAVYREVVGASYVETFAEGAAKKYGTPEIDGEDLDVWFTDPAMNAGNWHSPARCEEYFSLGQVPGVYIGSNCGSFVARRDGGLLMIDTRYNALDYLRAAEEAKAADEAIAKPEIAF